MNMTMIKRIFAIIFIGFFSISASSQNYIINTDNFNSFEINQALDVFLHQADSSYIELKGSNVNLSKVHIDNDDDHLTINVEGAGNKNAKIHLYSKEYTNIRLANASSLSSIGQIKGEKLKIEALGASDCQLSLDYNDVIVVLSGASDMKIYGRVNNFDISVGGASDFDSYGTKNLNTKVQASGASDVYVNPDSSLIADLTGASTLAFKKEPNLKIINSSASSDYGQRDNSAEKVEFNDMSFYENGDTVRIDMGNGKRVIIIIDGENGVTINTNKKLKRKFIGNWSAVELGVNGYSTPKGSINMPKEYEFLELKYENSRVFNLNFMQQSINIINNKFGFVTGMGLRWLNYRFSNNVILSGDSTKIYAYYDNSPDKSYSKSKLTAWYLTIPMIFEFQTNAHHNSRSFHIGVGLIGGFKLGSHSKQVYTSSGSGKQKNKTRDNFHLQPFVLDATTRIGWGPINLFATYSLIDMFRRDRGPELRPFTLGVILPFT